MTTNSGIFGSSTFDNEAGVDGFEIGELAGAVGGTYEGNDYGDRISLGDDTTQQWLTLNYGPGGIAVGSDMASKFVVYEQASVQDESDPEGTAFEISFDGGATFFDAPTFGALSAVTLGMTHTQNQVVFDLLGLGLSVGDTITSVTIRNLTGLGPFSDPDILFAGLAGVVAPIPLPAGGLLLLSGFGALTALRRRKKA